MSKLYVAGSLFNEAEVNQRVKEGNMLKHLTNYEVFNPITDGANDKSKLPTANDVFNADTDRLLEADVVVADISNQSDPGVFVELGITYACNLLHRLIKEGKSLEKIQEIMKKKTVLTHLSDIRKSTAHMYDGNEIPWGFNAYVIGCVYETDGKIKDNFQEVLDELV